MTNICGMNCGVAVISALSMQADPKAAARELRRVVDQARAGER